MSSPSLTIPANIEHIPMMKSMLKTADPTMVPTPTSLFAINTPEIDKQECKSKHF